MIPHKAKRTSYVPNEEVLGEILGHSDFDGEEWAIGDVVVFEDGTIAKIELVPGDRFHVWSEPRPAELGQVVAQIKNCGQARDLEGVRTWEHLFEILSAAL